jgi:hypothetical protein
MKNMKNIIMLALLIISAQSLFAENKQQITLSNDYGSDVACNLTWQNKSFPYNYIYQDVALEQNIQNGTHKAPISGYHLKSMDVAPIVYKDNSNELTALNFSLGALQIGKSIAVPTSYSPDLIDLSIRGVVAVPFLITGVTVGLAAGAMTLVGDAITHADNHHKVNTGNDSYFVIEKSKKIAARAGVKHIVIKKYASQKHYEEEIAKMNTPVETAKIEDNLVSGLEEVASNSADSYDKNKFSNQLQDENTIANMIQDNQINLTTALNLENIDLATAA